mmetsp:Transcript_17451/g.26893  ORF Transcript_17451/g.26893 Transcript_17451/m.26893 type:complete len:87 (+) Transcript_17451:3182-3442(+)
MTAEDGGKISNTDFIKEFVEADFKLAERFNSSHVSLVIFFYGAYVFYHLAKQSVASIVSLICGGSNILFDDDLEEELDEDELKQEE